MARELTYSERPADVGSARIPHGLPNEGLKYSNVDDNHREEEIALQRQQTVLQIQQNRIVELLAVNQTKNKLPQPRVPTFDGNPVDYRSFIRAFESLKESRT